MKIYRSDLMRIVKEELLGVLKEVNPIIGVAAARAGSSPLRSKPSHTA